MSPLLDHSLSAFGTVSTFSYGIPLAAFTAGLIGSPHCAMMCGPLAFQFAQEKKSLFLYHSGRMISYSLIGAVAGAIGNSLFNFTYLPWFSTFAIAALTLAFFAMSLRAWRGQTSHVHLPKPITNASRSFWMRVRAARPSIHVMAFVSGISTVLLPCGHLYGFILGAMATGSVIKASLFMFIFWLSTVPALGFGSRYFQAFLHKQPLHRQRVAGIILALAGLFSLANFAKQVYSLGSPSVEATGSEKATGSSWSAEKMMHHHHH
jgi:sulfite exporter TauE/SafE